ncbi:LacI family DNA-binding transcriptional regulator [Planomicrobium sp. CPCC 101110]|uniref:LacI family DNA-binding transcriptional regulator n=1 Tax=Planomicrobium sp. CPCC 101110 TaxID=2599619 RepID=UPI0011B828DD|nr:LacI family DNA-binding transcriptional regulator [Planomicrobium sp. CPCC 101110]TWT27755.1 LacI family transcriptional regulator [Planomicrobium sp. CPCC 101110]
MTVTIKDIAKVAGVSYSTVSKALNDSPLVKEKTKTKVLAIAQEMGYEPNFAAQRLVSKKTKIIGLIWPTIERVVLAVLVTKISNEINKTPYSMILSVEPVDKSLETFKKYQVDGVILFEEDVGIQARNYPFPVLVYGVSSKSHSSYPVIDPNHEQAILQAVSYLYELGHRNIAYIGYISKADPRQLKKYEAFRDAIKKFNLDVPDESNIINTGGLDWHAGYSAVHEFLASPNRATAIVGGSYDISSGIIRGLKQHHIDIPKDISLISYDNIPQMATLEIPLTSVGVPIEDLAKKIVDTIIKLVEDENPVQHSTKLTPVLSERNSCIKRNTGTDFN